MADRAQKTATRSIRPTSSSPKLIGMGSLAAGLLALLIQLSSIPIRPPDDPAQQGLIVPFHNVSSPDPILGDGYGRVKWWYDEQVDDEELNLSGKVALITGGNSGIGRAVAAELCRIKADKIIITSRSLARAKKAAEDMIAEGSCKDKQIHPATLDLGDLNSVRSFAQDFLVKNDRLHYLVMNAGGSTLPGKHQFDYITETGHEYSYVGNYLGHFLLVNLLLDTIQQSAPARITATSSIMHWNAMVNDLPAILPSGSNAMRSLEARFPTPNSLYLVLQQYSNTKFLQVVMCFELQRRLGPDSGITVVPLAPGYINTNIASGNRDSRVLFSTPLKRSPKEGAKTTLHALLSRTAEGKIGYFLQPYWSPMHLDRPSQLLGFTFRVIIWEVLLQRTSWGPHWWLPHPDTHQKDYACQLWEESLRAVGMPSEALNDSKNSADLKVDLIL